MDSRRHAHQTRSRGAAREDHSPGQQSSSSSPALPANPESSSSALPAALPANPVRSASRQQAKPACRQPAKPVSRQQAKPVSRQQAKPAAKSLVCPYCPGEKTFSMKHNMVEHIRGFHEPDRAKPRCEHCGKTFSRTSSVTKHIREVHQAIKVFCPSCPSVLQPRAVAVRKHIRSEHPDIAANPPAYGGTGDYATFLVDSALVMRSTAPVRSAEEYRYECQVCRVLMKVRFSESSRTHILFPLLFLVSMLHI